METVTRSNATVSTGGTEREHLLQVCKQTGKTLEELGIELPETDGQDIPEGGEFLWETFWDLSLSRGNNGFSENPLSWQELHAFAVLNGLDLSPYQAATLRSMDRAYLIVRAELAAKNTKTR